MFVLQLKIVMNAILIIVWINPGKSIRDNCNWKWIVQKFLFLFILLNVLNSRKEAFLHNNFFLFCSKCWKLTKTTLLKRDQFSKLKILYWLIVSLNFLYTPYPFFFLSVNHCSRQINCLVRLWIFLKKLVAGLSLYILAKQKSNAK